MDPKVDLYLSDVKAWQPELTRLRTILLETQLTEEIKWGSPCYSLNKKNVCIIGPLKDCCVLSFFKGALLKDPGAILETPGPNTRSARIIKITSVKQIISLDPVIRSYIEEAMQLEAGGVRVDFAKDRNHASPDELTEAFARNSKLKFAFEALTPGRRRAYLMYFNEPKQSKTRSGRIEKWIPKILQGKGMADWK